MLVGLARPVGPRTVEGRLEASVLVPRLVPQYPQSCLLLTEWDQVYDLTLAPLKAAGAARIALLAADVGLN